MKGFTIIEVLVVIVILAVAAGALTPVIRMGIDSWVFARDQKEILAEGTLCMNRMIAEIRQITEVLAAPNEHMCVYVLLIDSTPLPFSFYQSGTTQLYRTDYATSTDTILSDNLKGSNQGLVFIYLDEEMNDLGYPGNGSDRLKIRHIRIRLTLSIYGRDYVFQTTVTPLGLQ